MANDGAGVRRNHGVFGVAGAAHKNGGRYGFRYAWPSGRWGSLPLEGGIEAAYRADLAAADDPAAKLVEIEDRLNKLRSPFRSAETFWIEEIVDPRSTRPLLCEFVNLAAPLVSRGRTRTACGRRPQAVDKGPLLCWHPRPLAQRERLHLACGLRAPPRSWTFLATLRPCISGLQATNSAGPFQQR